MAIHEQTVVEHLLALAPFASPSEASSAVHAALTALRGGLTDDEAQALAEEIDAPWAAPLREGSYAGELSREEFYRLIAFHEQRRPSIAAEHAQLVCRVLSRLLSHGALQRLRQAVPALAGELVDPAVERDGAPAQHRSTPAAAHTLAAGRPGGSRPLSDARPTSPWPLSVGKPEIVHSHSIARSDDPHGDTKLSGAHALTEERDREPLTRSQRILRR